MKKILVLMASSVVFGCAEVQKVEVPKNKEQKIVQVGEETSMKLLKTLKGALMDAMQKGGPDEAVEVCSKKAMALTSQIEKETGYSVKRTTFNYRNPANAPDKYEAEALRYFEESIKKGQMPQYYVQAINENGKVMYRYYKPLKVEGVCLTCHGDPNLMDKKLLEKIKALYPNDKAVGYKDGDFRGVVRVTIPADKI
ncbi:MAG: Tll0287-like domain-containing protein [Sulfurihydrogenibium sp.]|uniref:Tll0287-like domain-containing protein n=1 Tax=Sulfurihydrogenibium sp. TaxID=2053621 RepID=UPI003C7E2F63